MVEPSSVSLLFTLTCNIDILLEKLTPQIGGVEFERHLLYTMPLGLGFHVNPVFFVNTLVVT